MLHDRKVASYKSRMVSAGVWPTTAVPGPWKFLWACGINLAPPPFLGAVALYVIGFLIGWPLTFVTSIVCSFLRGYGHTAGDLAKVTLVMSLLFGVYFAIYYRRLARKYQLGPWAQFR